MKRAEKPKIDALRGHSVTGAYHRTAVAHDIEQMTLRSFQNSGGLEDPKAKPHTERDPILSEMSPKKRAEMKLKTPATHYNLPQGRLEREK